MNRRMLDDVRTIRALRLQSAESALGRAKCAKSVASAEVAQSDARVTELRGVEFEPALTLTWLAAPQAPERLALAISRASQVHTVAQQALSVAEGALQKADALRRRADRRLQLIEIARSEAIKALRVVGESQTDEG